MSSDALHTTVQQLTSELMQRMDYFEAELKQNTNPTPTVASLAADFTAFRNFTVSTLRSLQDQIQLASQTVDRLEMHARRKILLVHGVPEEQQENTSACVVKMMVSNLKLTAFTASDIGRCHRMGRATSNRPRPILIKIRDMALRDKIWFSKSLLKDSGITLSEFLTKARHEVFMKARQHFGVNKCWTREGNVYVAGEGSTRHRVNWMGDLQKLMGSHHQVPTDQRSPRIVVASPEGAATAVPVVPVTSAPVVKTRRAATSKK